MEGVIYKYTSPVGKIYIGQTTDEVRRRRDFLGIKEVYAGPKINRARKKYGTENFKYSVLVRVESDNVEELHNYLNLLEKGFIRMYDTIKNGYNSCDGGTKNVSGFHHSEKTKQIISEKKKGKPSWNKGIPMTEEAKIKLSESKKGTKHFGVHPSEETKKKISESQKGKHYLKGIPKSDEHRKHLSESHKGRKRAYEEDGIHFHYIKIIDN